jgi:hypothetical protein
MVIFLMEAWFRNIKFKGWIRLSPIIQNRSFYVYGLLIFLSKLNIMRTERKNSLKFHLVYSVLTDQ